MCGSVSAFRNTLGLKSFKNSPKWDSHLIFVIMVANTWKNVLIFLKSELVHVLFFTRNYLLRAYLLEIIQIQTPSVKKCSKTFPQPLHRHCSGSPENVGRTAPGLARAVALDTAPHAPEQSEAQFGASPCLPQRKAAGTTTCRLLVAKMLESFFYFSAA